MKPIRFFFPILCFVLVVLMLYFALNTPTVPLKSTLIGKKAPVIYAPKLYDSTKIFDSKTMQGKKWMLNFFASWCEGCYLEHGTLMQLDNEYNAIIIGVNYHDKESDALYFLNKQKNPYETTVVDSGDIGLNYGVYKIPETFLIDEEGVIYDKYSGPINQQVMRKYILPWLDGKSYK